MRHIKLILNAFVAVLFWMTINSAANAQMPRAYVSAQHGDDANPCTLDRPCRNFAQAIATVVRNGEVVVLDSGDFAPVIINQAVAIIASPGVYAGITVTTDDGVTIKAGYSDTIVLRGLTINLLGRRYEEVNGIHYFSGRVLHVESCVINGGFQGTGSLSAGILFEGDGELFVKDTMVRGGVSNDGIFLTGGTISTSATIEHCRLEENRSAVTAVGHSRVTVRDSIAASNYTGFSAANGAEMNIENCLSTRNYEGISATLKSLISVSNSTVTNNVVGILSGNGSTIRVSNTTITRNRTGLFAGDSNLLSRANNTVEENETNGSFTGTFLPK